MRISPQMAGSIHFIGIGGIGMSGIADILRTLEYQVQGSDLYENANVERLRAKGIPITIGHKLENLNDAAVIVISSDIQATNIELIEARRRGLPVVKRAEMLAEIMRLRPAIAIAGTHGKTTTTSLCATLLEAGGLDPTVVSGGVINSYGTNAKLGKGEWMIAEADESDGSFIKLPATIAVVTNIEPEHLNFYHSFQQIKDAFYTFIENIPFYGLAIVCGDHSEVKQLLPYLTDRRVITYGFEDQCDVQAYQVRLTSTHMVFNLKFSEHFMRLCPWAPCDTPIENISVSLLGEHNVLNSLATIVCALELQMDWKEIRSGLAHFAGVSRRFTKVGIINDITIIDDYAHHPTEINAVLKTARSITSNKVIAVMQPHRYSRLHHLFKDFTSCFQYADSVVITPLYAAGETPIENIDHHALAKAVSKTQQSVHIVQDQEKLTSLLAELATPGDYIICMGAGDITKWAHNLPNNLNNHFFGESHKRVSA